MYTKQLDNGILNAYAVETEMYYAVSPSPEQQRNYACRKSSYRVNMPIQSL